MPSVHRTGLVGRKIVWDQVFLEVVPDAEEHLPCVYSMSLNPCPCDWLWKKVWGR